MESAEGRKNSKITYPFFSIIITEHNLTSPRLDGPSRDRFTFHRQRNRCKRGTFKPFQTGGAIDSTFHLVFIGNAAWLREHDLCPRPWKLTPNNGARAGVLRIWFKIYMNIIARTRTMGRKSRGSSRLPTFPDNWAPCNPPPTPLL